MHCVRWRVEWWGSDGPPTHCSGACWSHNLATAWVNANAAVGTVVVGDERRPRTADVVVRITFHGNGMFTKENLEDAEPGFVHSIDAEEPPYGA